MYQVNHQSYRDVFVTNNPALLKSGTTEQLAVGQIGILNYDPTQDQVALNNPTFTIARIIQIAQGTPELASNALAPISNKTDKSKPIKGKLIVDWKGAKATRGQNQVIAIGYDGVDTSKTLTAKCEQTKSVFLKLSGGPIDQIFHTEGKGKVIIYNIFSGCCDDCGDDCAGVAAEGMADDLINQINNDPILSLGGQGTLGSTDFRGNRLVRARKAVPAEDVAEPAGECTEYLLSVCDNGGDSDLGLVQSSLASAYSGTTFTGTASRKSRNGSVSTYQVIVPDAYSAPNAYSNAGVFFITDCPTCPTGYTLSTGGFAYEIQRQDAGISGALTTLKSDYGISTATESASRLSYQYGQSNYIVVSDTEINAAIGTDVLVSLGDTREKCVITTPSSTAWVVGDTYEYYEAQYTIDLQDNVCGTSRLAELQAAYPNLVIAETVTGECVRTFATTVKSNCVAPGCPPDAPQFIAPDPFYGSPWKTVVPTPGSFPVGVILESAYVDRTATECAFDYWRYDAEPIIIEVSQHSQDYNDKPTICSDEWPVTEIQGAKLPTGVGAYVREQEKWYKGYRNQYRDENPIYREIDNSVLQTDPNKFYDMYSLKFQFEYNQGWFARKETDTYILDIYFPEGQGKEYEAVINAYISSAAIDLPPVVL